MNLVQNLLSKLLPSKSRVVKKTFYREPEVKAHMLDVDLLHQAFRDAEGGYPADLFGLYRDMIGSHTHLQSEFSKRKLAVLGDTFTLTPQDPDDKNQVAHIKSVKDHLETIPDWFHTLAHILDSVLYPVSVTEKVYRPSDKDGWRYEFADLAKVPHHDLSWPQGEFSFRVTTEEGHFTGEDIPVQCENYIIHRGHLLTSLPDWHGGPMRAVMFWWLFSVGSRDWWARFLERFGSPFLEGSYDSNDDGTRFELEDAFRAAQRLFGIVASKEAEIKMHQANTQGGGQAFEAFHNVANKEISKIVVGQTMSAESSNVGLGGGGQGKIQSQVRDDIRQWDATMLSHTIKTQILKPLWTINGWSSPMPDVNFGGESTEEQEVTGAILTALSQGGLQITDDGISIIGQKIGFPVERIKTDQPALFNALSASPSFDTAPFIPMVERRAERKRQARRATESMLSAASKPLAEIMRKDLMKFENAILESSSPDDALNRIAKLSAEYEPDQAAELFEHAMTAASVNSIIASDR